MVHTTSINPKSKQRTHHQPTALLARTNPALMMQAELEKLRTTVSTLQLDNAKLSNTLSTRDAALDTMQRFALFTFAAVTGSRDNGTRPHYLPLVQPATHPHRRPRPSCTGSASARGATEAGRNAITRLSTKADDDAQRGIWLDTAPTVPQEWLYSLDTENRLSDSDKARIVGHDIVVEPAMRRDMRGSSIVRLRMVGDKVTAGVWRTAFLPHVQRTASLTHPCHLTPHTKTRGRTKWASCAP